MKPKNIYLVRHGQSIGNADRSNYDLMPDWKIPLSDLGREQSIKAGEELRRMCGNRRLYVFSSPYKRAVDTTAQIIRQVGPSVDIGAIDPRLREIELGSIRGDSRSVEKARAEYGPFFYRFPGGESGCDVYDRCAAFIHDTLNPLMESGDLCQSDVCIVSHAFTIRVFLMRFLSLGIDWFDRVDKPDNCQIITLSLNDRGQYELQTPLKLKSF